VVPQFLLFFLFYLPFSLYMTRRVHIKIEVQVNLLLELRCIFGPLFFRVGHVNEVWRPQFGGFRWRCSKAAKIRTYFCHAKRSIIAFLEARCDAVRAPTTSFTT
jgi:hypothetical protein